MSPTGQLPFIMTKTGKCCAGPQLDRLLLNRINYRVGLSEDESELLNLVYAAVQPVWMSEIWSDRSIYRYILSPLYSPEYCPMVRGFLMWHRRWRTTSYPISDESLVCFDDALTRLAERLGDQKYFGGESVCALDALLGPNLLLIPFYLPASHPLHQIFSRHYNLYDYSIHMLEYLRHDSSA